jgi:hypothetical protein
MNNHEGTERLSKKGSDIHDQVSLTLKACRHHNLPEAMRWAKAARADMNKFIAILEAMQAAEKKDALKYYHV